MTAPILLGRATLHLGDCLAVLRTLPDASVEAIVTDPPYGLAFMGKHWDYDVPDVEVWQECLRVLKPGGHLLAFAGTRTFHRMAVRIEDAGFEIRDMIAWVYGSGFPKSLDVSKAVDKTGGVSVAWFGPWLRKWREDNGVTQKQVAALFPSKTGGLTGCVANWELGFNMPTPEQFNLIRDTFGLPFASVEEAEREVVGQQRGTMLAVAPGQDNDRSATTLDITAPATDAARQWQGWGTALKPALEPIALCRKPLDGTVAQNVLTHGTGALNVDGCRVGKRERERFTDAKRVSAFGGDAQEYQNPRFYPKATTPLPPGRFPANLIHDGSDEVVALFPQTTSGGSQSSWGSGNANLETTVYGEGWSTESGQGFHDTGSAARFFYCAKADKSDRDEGCHDLPEVLSMRYGEKAQGPLPQQTPSKPVAQRNHHPTVKPTDLMRYLCRLVTPPGGTILDPFMGSGSTGRGAALEGFHFIGIEREPDYLAIAQARIKAAQRQPDLFHAEAVAS